MSFEGRVENGAIVLEPPTPLPEGARVRVEIISAKKKPELPPKTKGRNRVRKSKAARYPLTNEELEILGAKHKPAPSWFEEKELP